jgi:hypothetical protein
MMRLMLELVYRRYRRQLAIIAIAGALFVLSSCATQPVQATDDAPGFLFGLFHGFTMMFSLIGELFTDNRVYAFPNSGGWYDLGFVLGAASFFGGGGASAR